jgi:phage/plasmid-associated DNA primase
VAAWIEDRREEWDAPALAWLVQRAAFALIGCYPAGQGKDVLWGVFRTIAGAEAQARGEATEPPAGA